MPQCDIAHFSANLCPVDSQLGITEALVEAGGFFGTLTFISPIYNLVPAPGEPALFGYETFLDTPIYIVISDRTNSDYGVDSTITGINHVAPLRFSRTIFWGVPASPTHNALRFEFSEVSLGGFFTGGREWLCRADGSRATADPASAQQMCHFEDLKRTTVGKEGPVASSSPEIPFWQNPTTCGLSSLQSSVDVLSYDGGTTNAAFPLPPTTECSQLSFNPSLFARPTSTTTDSPSGIDIVLKAPSFESPSVPSPSEIRSAVVTLPPGFSLDANAADGKTACTDAEANFGTLEEANCPEFAKVGTLEVHSAILPGVLPGAVYIGQPLPGERYRLILTANGFGVHVKLSGTIRLDSNTGQLVTEFRNLPQSPFEEFDLHFFGSEHGSLATPTQCGTYPVTTEFKPWDAALPNQTSTQYFTLDEGPRGTPCPNGLRPFAPGFETASSANTAGAHTSFALEVSREDGEQNLTSLKITTPPGFSATLSGIPYCPEADIAAAMAPSYSGLAEQQHPSCPPASLVGEAIAGAGAGTHPFYAPGKVYLAGPYKGAPLSLLVITPAVEGPYDLGNVVVRVALRIDHETAQVTTVTEGLPQILEGVPLRLRSILVNLNRPNFALNPTDCEPLSVQTTVSGSEGATATPSSPFQVANCASLPFRPQLSLSLRGKTTHTGNPALDAVLAMKPGEANLSRTSVALPSSEFLDNAHLQLPCTRVQYAAQQCPPGSVIGFAKAETPLLEKPLEGPVYLRSSSRRLPDIVAALRGQVSIDLVGRVEPVPGHLRTTFETPDTPVSHFFLHLDGGSKGLIQNSEPLCTNPQFATVAIDAQNGKIIERNQKLAIPCGSKKHRRASHSHQLRISEKDEHR